ncbi:uncharacterized protein LOC114335503 [Diabrotica virgifera virgifera]|uniref:Uncharacterized protein LOC114335503 n=1 Tax=Diabrotica virgifera virgifera TaxID=50390 RepID=A0A6P7FYH1_DIAVI|nr:uncharacterized protein LOC114335503 [Diabrotica virgifera virgifera]
MFLNVNMVLFFIATALLQSVTCEATPSSERQRRSPLTYYLNIPSQYSLRNSHLRYKYQPIYPSSINYPTVIGGSYYPGISSPVLGQYPGVIFQYPIYETVPIQGQYPIQSPSLPAVPQGDGTPAGGVLLDHDTVSVDAAY